MDLEKIVQQELAKIISSGFVEEKINSTLQKTLSSIIENTLKDWSDFGKSLNEKLSESLCIDLGNISIPEYSNKMLSYITDEVDLLMKTETKEILQKRIKKFFKPLEKDEYKVSELVEKFKDSIVNEFTDDYDNICESHEITAFVESKDDGYFDLMLDSEPDKSRYECKVSIRMKADEGIWHINYEDSELHKSRKTIMGNFERTLFQLFSQKINIINDFENIDNYINSSFD